MNRHMRRWAKRNHKPTCPECNNYILEDVNKIVVKDTTYCFDCGVNKIKNLASPIVVLEVVGDVKMAKEYNTPSDIEALCDKPQVVYEMGIPCLWLTWGEVGSVSRRVRRVGPVVKGINLLSHIIKKVDTDKLIPLAEEAKESDHFVVTPLVDAMGYPYLYLVKNKDTGEEFKCTPDMIGGVGHEG